MRRSIRIMTVLLLLVTGSAIALFQWHRHGDSPEQLPEQAAPQKAVELSALPKVTEAANILEAIRKLESEKDPKCHSTACRFEDFLYGTPLTADARDEKVRQQKHLIRSIWQRASESAQKADRSVIELADIQPIIASVTSTAKNETGEIETSFSNEQFVVLSPVRARQYGSIAYSLRAILSAQQDAFAENGSALAPLDSESVDALRVLIDTVSLSTLKMADREARTRNAPEITRQIMRMTWSRILPQELRREIIEPRVAGNDSPKEKTVTTKERELSLLGSIIEAKIDSYRIYNHVEARHTSRVFLENITTYYALYPLLEEVTVGTGDGYQTIVRNEEQSRDVLSAHQRMMVEFARGILDQAEKHAAQRGDQLVRAEDAEAAVEQLTPHQIDALEDVHFFPHLGGDERITLESYDCDSYRDFGLHWKFMKDALEQAPRLSVIPDPFAAEIIAESISQYGVLLFRLSGKHAKTSHAARHLRVADLEHGKSKIEQLAKRHHRTDPAATKERDFVSAANSSAGDTKTTYFTDITDRTSVNFLHRSSRWLGKFRRTRTRTLPTFSGGGVAAEDINNDTYIDLLFAGGAGNALLLNDGQGKFTDVTEEAGLRYRRPDGQACEARQPIIADFDNDGLQDIFITNANDPHRLYRNVGGTRFQDVTSQANLGGAGLIGGPATVFDFDRDGLLDIYICYFGDYLQDHGPRMNRDNRNALPNVLFRNLGGMRFENVTQGRDLGNTGWAQAVSHTDFDRDGWQDIIVANDFGRNLFLRNRHDGRFENVAPSMGLTNAFHSMNVGISDLNGDGFPDVYISNIATLVKDNKYTLPDVKTPLNFDLRAMAGMLVKESDVLYVSGTEDGKLSSYSQSKNIERGATSTGWAWDAEFFDFDNDGDDDLYVVNGANDYNLLYSMFTDEKDGQPTVYHLNHNRQSNVFFVNEGGKLKNRFHESGADFVGNSRSTAYLDLEGDGDLDIAVNNFHDPAVILRNNSESRGQHWIKFRLIGDPQRGSNRDAIGARLFVTTASGLRIRREIQGGSGYLSMNPKQQHVGLGGADTADLQITWPNGEQHDISGLAADQSHTIDQSQLAENPPR